MPKTKNVTAGKPKISGAIFCAPIGTALPTAIDAELDTAFIEMGYCSADGVTLQTSRTSSNYKAWGGEIVLAQQTEYADTAKFTLIETLDINVQKVIHGDSNVTGTLDTGVTVKENSKDLDERCWVIDTLLRGAARRIVIAKGKITEIGETKYVDSDIVSHPITITAMPDDDGNTHYEYTKKTN